MLSAALPVAAGLGIDPVLVTCDDTNVGSRKVIEANGGLLEDQRGGEAALLGADLPLRAEEIGLRRRPTSRTRRRCYGRTTGRVAG